MLYFCILGGGEAHLAILAMGIDDVKVRYIIAY